MRHPPLLPAVRLGAGARRACARVRVVRVRAYAACVCMLAVAACSSGGVETRGIGTPPPLEETSAFVLTSDFQTGSFAVFPLADPTAVAKNLDRIHSDAVARTHDGLVYVVNRLGGDSVQAIDPRAAFATRWQCSVGNGTNPHDVAFAAPDKAYVTRYESAEILIVDPSVGADCAGFVRGTIDLASLADADGVPEMDQALVLDGRLFVTLQRLDRRNFFRPSDLSLIAVIDVATDQLVDTITLTGTNPFAESAGLAVDPRTGAIAVGAVGDFGAIGDGGIELVDPVALRAEGFLVTEADLGGNVTDFVLVGATQAYAIVLDADVRNHVVRFDPTTRTVVRTLLEADDFLVDLELGPDGRTLYVTDRTLRKPGIRRYDVADDDRPLDDDPIDTGLPPFDLVFVTGP